MQSIQKSEFTLQELKLLDIYLARIDSHFPEKRIVVFSKNELENVLHKKQIKPDELKKQLYHLANNTVVLQAKNDKEPVKIKLFEYANTIQDENGVWQIMMSCSIESMKYIFCIDKLGYVSYKLSEVAKLSGLYSYYLFIYLNSIRRIAKGLTWKVSLPELKNIVNCDDEKNPVYKDFRRFNDRLLKLAHNEINKKTCTNFDYKTTKTGIKVTGIKFILKSLTSKDQNSFTTDDNSNPQIKSDNAYQANQTTENDALEEAKVKIRETIEASFAEKEKNIGALLEIYFDFQKSMEIQRFVNMVPKSNFPILRNYSWNDDYNRKYEYVKEKLINVLAHSSKDSLENKYSFLLESIKQDIPSPTDYIPIEDAIDDGFFTRLSERKSNLSNNNTIDNFDDDKLLLDILEDLELDRPIFE